MADFEQQKDDGEAPKKVDLNVGEAETAKADFRKEQMRKSKEDEFIDHLESTASTFGISYEDLEEALTYFDSISAIESDEQALNLLTECIGISNYDKINKESLKTIVYSAVYLCNTENFNLDKASEFINKYWNLDVMNEVYDAMQRTNSVEVNQQYGYAESDFDEFDLGKYKDVKGSDFPGTAFPGDTYLMQAFKLRLLGYRRDGEPGFPSVNFNPYVGIRYSNFEIGKTTVVTFYLEEPRHEREDADRLSSREQIKKAIEQVNKAIEQASRAMIEDLPKKNRVQIDERKAKVRLMLDSKDPETVLNSLASMYDLYGEEGMEEDQQGIHEIASDFVEGFFDRSDLPRDAFDRDPMDVVRQLASQVEGVEGDMAHDLGNALAYATTDPGESSKNIYSESGHSSLPEIADLDNDLYE